MCVAGASLCSYSAPGLRWFLASIWKTRVVWVCGVCGAGNLTILNVKSKGHALCVVRVRFCVAPRPRIYGGVVAHLPDMGRPMCSSACMMYAGRPHERQELAFDRKYSHM